MNIRKPLDFFMQRNALTRHATSRKIYTVAWNKLLPLDFQRMLLPNQRLMCCNLEIHLRFSTLWCILLLCFRMFKTRLSISYMIFLKIDISVLPNKFFWLLNALLRHLLSTEYGWMMGSESICNKKNVLRNAQITYFG